jgi:hypothetical protein
MARGEGLGEKATSIRIVNKDVDHSDVAYIPWRTAVRKLCGELLDLSILCLLQQEDKFWGVRTAMENGWEYLGGQLSQSRLCRYVVRIQKRRRRFLFCKWAATGLDVNAGCPRRTPADQWQGLIRYWTSKKFDQHRDRAARLPWQKREKYFDSKCGIGIRKPAMSDTPKQQNPKAASLAANVKGVTPIVDIRNVRCASANPIQYFSTFCSGGGLWATLNPY